MTYEEEINDGEYKITKEVFENGSDKETICELDNVDKHKIDDEDIAMYNLLHSIKDYFGCCYNKHSEINLVIKFEKE
jgi:hypothetical protein